MLFFVDLPTAHARLTAGGLRCPSPDCRGQLGPWGSARERSIRHAADHHERVTPRRARCRSCKQTHVLASGATFPGRSDSSTTVLAALLAASSGLGHRPVAELVGLPHTTVRDWLRRSHANAERVWRYAARWVIDLESSDAPFLSLAAAPLTLALDSVGHATAAWTRRFGPVAERWHLAVVLTGGLLLAPVHADTPVHLLDNL